MWLQETTYCLGTCKDQNFQDHYSQKILGINRYLVFQFDFKPLSTSHCKTAFKHWETYQFYLPEIPVRKSFPISDEFKHCRFPVSSQHSSAWLKTNVKVCLWKIYFFFYKFWPKYYYSCFYKLEINHLDILYQISLVLWPIYPNIP